MDFGCQILRRKTTSVAHVGDDRDVVTVAEQRVCRFEQKRVPAMPLGVRIGKHPSHCVDGRSAIVDMQHHWKPLVGL